MKFSYPSKVLLSLGIYITKYPNRKCTYKQKKRKSYLEARKMKLDG
jgi:hypothetical protein